MRRVKACGWSPDFGRGEKTVSLFPIKKLPYQSVTPLGEIEIDHSIMIEHATRTHWWPDEVQAPLLCFFLACSGGSCESLC